MTRNRVFAAAMDVAATVRLGLPVSVSDDGGVTWQSPYHCRRH